MRETVGISVTEELPFFSDYADEIVHVTGYC
jgi:hypothetical protein